MANNKEKNQALDDSALENVTGGAVWKDKHGAWHIVDEHGNVGVTGNKYKSTAQFRATFNGDGRGVISTNELNALRKANGKKDYDG